MIYYIYVFTLYGTSCKLARAPAGELKNGSTSEGKLVFGYNIGSEDSSVTVAGQTVNVSNPIGYGSTNMETKTAYVDLADFDGQNALGSWVSETGNFSKRMFNLGRLVEHEFIGHAVGGLRDPSSVNGRQTGDTVDLINIFRGEMELPHRSDYRSGFLHFNKGTDNPSAFRPSEAISKINKKL
ncbi:hypothetical protein [Nonlabens sp.]|uniref:hypothetical protein n=1 Tax=Nonlabens sp. TaxID=1888209 RepID=UPI003264BB8D